MRKYILATAVLMGLPLPAAAINYSVYQTTCGNTSCSSFRTDSIQVFSTQAAAIAAAQADARGAQIGCGTIYHCEYTGFSTTKAGCTAQGQEASVDFGHAGGHYFCVAPTVSSAPTSMPRSPAQKLLNW